MQYPELSTITHHSVITIGRATSAVMRCVVYEDRAPFEKPDFLRFENQGERKMHPSIICLSGKAGSGKDTAALMMAAERPYRVVGLADQMKGAYCVSAGLDPAKMERGKEDR